MANSGTDSYSFGFFWVSCEELFTTETQRRRAATKIRNVSRKARKDRQVEKSKFFEALGLGGLCVLGVL
ncbi:MAG: hypothetical protein U1E51_03570, partial [Candidatus Binatia bacterium]|nr:hypothetical protein [Candidatus Binatia bacterium]